MARYDKYNPYGGGFRAFLAADWDVADAGKPYAMGLNTSGQLVKGAGNSGVVGVLVLTRAIVATREPVDVMKFGEIVLFAPTATDPLSGGTGVAGTSYYANTTTGVISATGGTGTVKVGHTVEADRLVVAIDSLAAA